MRILLLLLGLLWAVPAQAAVTLTLDRLQTITLDATPFDVTQVTLPKGCRWLILRFVAADGFIDWVLPSIADSAAMSANALTVDADTLVGLRAPSSGAGKSSLSSSVVVHLAHTNAAGVVQTICTSDGGG